MAGWSDLRDARVLCGGRDLAAALDRRMLAPLIDADLRYAADGEPEIRGAEAACEERLRYRQAIKCTATKRR